MTSVALQRETAASAFDNLKFSDVELVFVQEQLAGRRGGATRQKTQPKTKSGKAAKRKREGVN